MKRICFGLLLVVFAAGCQPVKDPEEKWIASPTKAVTLKTIDPPPSPTPEKTSPFSFGGSVLQLADGYEFARFLDPLQPVPNSITISENDTVFIGQMDSPPYLWSLNPQTGELRDLHMPKPWAVFHAGGPNDSILVNYHEEIWQVHADGSHEIWSTNPNFNLPLEYLDDGSLLAASGHRDCLVNMRQDGSESLIVSGLEGLEDIAVLPDGAILLLDVHNHDVFSPEAKLYRWTQEEGLILIQAGLDPYHPSLSTDPAGNAYMKTRDHGYARIHPQSGQLTSVTNDLNTQGCIRLFDHMDFLSSGELVVTDYRGFAMMAFDLQTRTGRILLPLPSIRTRAMDTGPDGRLYLGVNGCGLIPSCVQRILPDKTRETILSGLMGVLTDLTFGPDGALYMILDNRLVFLPAGSDVLQEIPLGRTYQALWTLSVNPENGHVFVSEFLSESIFEYSIEGLIAEHRLDFPKPPRDTYLEFSPLAGLFLFSHERENNAAGPVVERWILRYSPGAKSTVWIADLNLEGDVGPMGDMTVDRDGSIWIVTAPDSNLWNINLDGSVRRIAEGLPMDTLGIAVDSDRRVYLSHEEGIFEVFPSP